MMSSQIKFLRPELLNNESISSWFSLRNQDQVQPNRQIPGLNLGLNTNEEENVILENREKLLTQIGLEAHQIASATQIHETNVEVVSEGGTYSGTDALITNQPDLALAIQVADCAAILLADAKNRIIGAVHAGWRGAAANILPKTIRKMKKMGAEPEQLQAFISPCISLKNFEVGAEVAEQFPDKYVDRLNYKKPHVDLKAFLKDQLLNEGLSESQIEVHNDCTIESDEFYSHRRQKENSGRMMGIIKLN